MSNYSSPITATGSLITFNAPQGGLFDSLSVPITPTQNLNGYSKPWAGGAGVNLFPDELPANAFAGSISSSGVVGTATNSRIFCLPCEQNTDYTFTKNTTDSWTGLAFADSEPQIGDTVDYRGSMSSRLKWTQNSGNHTYIICVVGSVSAFNDLVTTKEAMIVKGSTEQPYTPYKNICPIIGLTGLSVYVSPTSNVADATEYALTFTEVLAGSIDPVLGVIKRRPVYSSYNGETLVGPWLSSMDEYAEGNTPTTGAQVVDLGGAESTSSITPSAMTMLTGTNKLWASTNAVLTLIYRLSQTAWMNGSTSIGKNASSLTVSAQFNGYSKVIVQLSEESWYEAGNDSGRTLTIDCPWGTQAMANNLLSLLEGFQYQPYEATDALLDPAAELGDGLTVNGVYGGIFSMTIRGNVLHSVDVSSPHDEEIEHEYNFVPATERRIERKFANVQSQLTVQSDQISAKVDREGGDPSSVSWEINADNFKVAVDGSDVLIVDDNGLTVHGDGTFDGEVKAKNIKYGGSSGTLSGGGITGGSLGTTKFNSGVNTSLGNADYSADVFSGAVRASWGKFAKLDTSYFKYTNKTISLVKYGDLNNTYKVLCTNEN